MNVNLFQLTIRAIDFEQVVGTVKPVAGTDGLFCLPVGFGIFGHHAAGRVKGDNCAIANRFNRRPPGSAQGCIALVYFYREPVTYFGQKVWQSTIYDPTDKARLAFGLGDAIRRELFCQAQF